MTTRTSNFVEQTREQALKQRLTMALAHLKASEALADGNEDWAAEARYAMRSVCNLLRAVANEERRVP